MIQSIHREFSPQEIASSELKGIVSCEPLDSDGGFFFKATNDDPQIYLKKIPLEPVGAVLNLEITVPQEVLVQVFYNTLESNDFSESNSLGVSLPGGKHRVEWLIDKPLSGFFRVDPGNLPGEYVIHKFIVSQNFRVYSLMPKSVLSEASHSNQLRDLKLDDSGLHMKATGRDPYLLLPKIELEPGPTVIKLDATLQRQSMVQVYFQLDNDNSFAEQHSVTASSPAGRQEFRWVLNHSLNGFFRLDPGNMPWEYTIHRLEALQGVYVREIKFDKILGSGSQINQIDQIESKDEGVCFEATGDDPWIVLPPMDYLPKSAKLKLDITLPSEVLVQLYYQTIDIQNFSEQLSLKKALPAGRHSVEWILEDTSVGLVRLDPGNLPGHYCIHKMQIQQ